MSFKCKVGETIRFRHCHSAKGHAKGWKICIELTLFQA